MSARRCRRAAPKFRLLPRRLPTKHPVSTVGRNVPVRAPSRGVVRAAGGAPLVAACRHRRAQGVGCCGSILPVPGLQGTGGGRREVHHNLLCDDTDDF